MSGTSTEILETYTRNEQTLRDELAVLERKQDWLSNLRLVAGLGIVGAAAWLLTTRSFAAVVLTVLFLLVFLFLVVRHRLTSALRRRTEVLADINAESVDRIHRNWAELPLRHDSPAEGSHPYANDLDIFGHGSVFHLLDTVSTRMGESELRRWLLIRAAPEDIAIRQEGVRELAPLSSWRQQLQMIGRITGGERSDPEAFLSWAEGDRAIDRRGYLVWLARLGLVATLVFGGLAIARVIEPAFVVIPLLANLVVSFGARPIVGERIDIARSQHTAMKGYGGLLEHLDTADFSSSLLASLEQTLGGSERPAHRELARLGRVTSWAVPRSALTHFPLQALASWDIHVLDALEGWQRTNGSLVRGWLRAIGVFEALSSLANLSHDNPGWVFASVESSHSAIVSQQLGHPLISDEHRVLNDVVVGPPGSFLLVTGSNMSGKSTLLRSIGVNTVLASAGGPSCATQYSLPPVALWTSVRVSDSLEQGISFYMAELLRLKEVHSAAESAATTGQPFCYLLDEILQGTNSAERQIAARHIIAQLVELGAIGAVSTHDLQLAEKGELAAKSVAVHFSDSVTDSASGPSMAFDYILRPGLATSTNALRLMELVGFNMPVPDGRPAPGGVLVDG
ncbi:MutS family DNA mismatch repair protein [soil metagenome]